MRLDGKIALVTGANQGLGKCYTEELLRRGVAKVYACGLTLDCLEPLCGTHGAAIVPLRLDVTVPSDIADAVTAAPDLDILFNNAGVLAARGLVEAGSSEELRREMAVNCYGLADMSVAFAPVIAGNGGGAIINMLSVASLASFPPFGTYCASKAAAMSITHCLRYELKDHGIEVFGIYAGLIDTEMIRAVKGDKADPKEIAAIALEAVEAGITDIDTDERTRFIRAMLKTDPKGLEDLQHERAGQFKAVQPVT